jgi:Arc/MetJ-type ribon-helix-helix transcriptional regulator
MKTTIHARLTEEDQSVLDSLKKTTGHNESELIRRGLRLLLKQQKRKASALDLAGESVGKFRKGPKDLSTNRKYLEGFGD